MPIIITRAKALQVASKKLRFLSEKSITTTLEFAGMSLAEAYKCGAEEAQSEIVNRLAVLGTIVAAVPKATQQEGIERFINLHKLI